MKYDCNKAAIPMYLQSFLPLGTFNATGCMTQTVEARKFRFLPLPFNVGVCVCDFDMNFGIYLRMMNLTLSTEKSTVFFSRLLCYCVCVCVCLHVKMCVKDRRVIPTKWVLSSTSRRIFANIVNKLKTRSLP